MSDISFNELKDKLALGEEDLRRALDRLISSELVIEMKSKHPVLGTTYKMNSMYSYLPLYSFGSAVRAEAEPEGDQLLYGLW